MTAAMYLFIRAKGVEPGVKLMINGKPCPRLAALWSAARKDGAQVLVHDYFLVAP